MMDRIDLEIRPERPPDFSAIRRLVVAAFESAAEARLVDLIRASEHYVPEMALVAVRNGEVVGQVMISGATLATPHGNRRIVMLAPLAVDPEAQRSGIGSALVRSACAVADQQQEPMVVVEGNPQYYGRFGFEPSFQFDIEMPVPDWAPREAGQVLRLSAFDPELTGTVVYPDAFRVVADQG